MSRNLSLTVQVDGKEREAYKPPYGARLRVKDGEKVKRGQRLAEWDPYTTPIITEVGGKVRFEDLVDEHVGPRGSRRSHRHHQPRGHRLARLHQGRRTCVRPWR